MPTTAVTADVFNVPAGQTVSAVGDTAVYVYNSPSGVATRVTIDGTLDARSSGGPWALDLNYEPSGTAPATLGSIVIGTSGVLRATDSSSSGVAQGFRSEIFFDLTNNGLVEVTGSNAIGIYGLRSEDRVTNHGTIRVQGDDVRGIAMDYGATIVNGGLIEVTGARSAIGISSGDFASIPGSILNTGSIRVHDSGASVVSVGVFVTTPGGVTNSGLIEADVAIRTATTSAAQLIPIVNTGQLIGSVEAIFHGADFTNSGLVTGDVRMGDADDRYDGRLGRVNGLVHGGGGADLLMGSFSAETLSGDAGDDTIEGGGGADVLDGGGGFDMLSYAHSPTAQTLDLSQPFSVGSAVNFEGVIGSGFDDSMSGSSSAESLAGGAGNDTVMAGAGNDTIDGGSGTSYLRGEDGNDSIAGGSAFDDINGNMGNDTAHGNGGDDWVVGGKDQDQLFGDAGGDVVWGNLGNDTLDCGDGADQVRGGQGDDVVNGGAGNDFVSGDRGNDTITGGTGADLFHDSQDASIDRVLDFSVAEGDRVMLDPGTTYTVSQVGADTVIDMGGGNQMILVGVQMSTLPPGTIFLG